MSVNEQREYDIVNRVIHGELTIGAAALLLGKSYRQTQRIVEAVKQEGMLGLKHGNLGKVPWNKISTEVKSEVLKLLAERYFDFNLQHFAEKLSTEHSISVKRETMRKWAHDKKLVKRAHHQNRRKKIHRSRHRMPKAGMLLQMDGSTHRWFGPQAMPTCLVGNIDDATSFCPYGEFFPAEDTIAVFTVLKRTVERVGIPEVLYVDQAGHFGKAHKYVKAVDWNKHLTHVERAMAELGCRVLFATSPEAKGRIERMWGTFQDRLTPELRIRNIRRIPSANYFLQQHFIPEFNQRWSVPASNPQSAYRAVPSSINLNDVFCQHEWRKVSRGETITYNGQEYSVHHDYQYSLRGLQIELRTALDGTSGAYHANRRVSLIPFNPARK